MNKHEAAQELQDAGYQRVWGLTDPYSAAASQLEVAYFGAPRSLEDRLLSCLREAARYMAHAEGLAAKIAEEKP